MRKVIAVLFACSLLHAGANGQVNAFVGYSFVHADLTSIPFASIPIPLVATGNLHGWNASIERERKLIWRFGLVVDFSGHYGSTTSTVTCNLFPQCETFPLKARLYNYLFGPQLSFTVGRVKPFARVLVGGSQVIEKFPRLSAMEASDASIADAIGGGLDYRLGGRVSWRTQADYLQTRFSSRSQNNARVSTGIVIRIGPFRI